MHNSFVDIISGCVVWNPIENPEPDTEKNLSTIVSVKKSVNDNSFNRGIRMFGVLLQVNSKNTPG